MFSKDEFRKYAVKHQGISSSTVDSFTSMMNNYISPTIIEERQMNVASMDVFSRLMMDRIIFLGVPINDYVANIIQAQLLFLESGDAKKDIQIYIASKASHSVKKGIEVNTVKDTGAIFNTDQKNNVEQIGHMRKLIAEHMRHSLDTSAHVYIMNEVDMTRIVNFIEENEQYFYEKINVL